MVLIFPASALTPEPQKPKTNISLNDFFGGKKNTEKAAIVPQSLLDQFGKFIEAHKWEIYF